MADETKTTEEPKAATPEAPKSNDLAQAIHELSHAPLSSHAPLARGSKPASDLVMVRHTKTHDNYVAGDVAGHPPAEAERLIAARLARALPTK